MDRPLLHVVRELILHNEGVLQHGPALLGAIGLGAGIVQLVLTQGALRNEGSDHLEQALDRAAPLQPGADVLEHEQRVAVDVVVGIGVSGGVVKLKDATGTHSVTEKRVRKQRDES